MCSRYLDGLLNDLIGGLVTGELCTGLSTVNIRKNCVSGLDVTRVGEIPPFISVYYFIN